MYITRNAKEQLLRETLVKAKNRATLRYYREAEPARTRCQTAIIEARRVYDEGMARLKDESNDVAYKPLTILERNMLGA